MHTITHWGFFAGRGEGHFAAAREGAARGPPTSERARERGANVQGGPSASKFEVAFSCKFIL